MQIQTFELPQPSPQTTQPVTITPFELDYAGETESTEIIFISIHLKYICSLTKLQEFCVIVSSFHITYVYMKNLSRTKTFGCFLN